jgi:hypothetical protein
MWQKEVKVGMKGATVAQHVAKLDAVTRPTIASLDGIVLWLGQHGTSNSPIPKVEDRSVVTSPQVSFVHYTSFLLRGINAWRKDDPLGREEIWLLPDARNYIKGRDLKWPRQHPVLCQFDWSRREWCERYGDTRTPAELGFSGVEVIDGKWRVTDRYVGSGLELVGIPESWHTLDYSEREHDFGILINEARAYGMKPEMMRLHAMQHYVKPLNPSWVHGTWPKESQEKLGMRIDVIPDYNDIFKFFQHTKCTFTTPSSGSHWATAKPWESFSNGTVCFFHPLYDTQGHIIPTKKQTDRSTELGYLAHWLRIDTPEELRKKVEAVSSSRETYEWLAQAQFNHFIKAQEDKRCVRSIEKRLGLTASSSPAVNQPA